MARPCCPTHRHGRASVRRAASGVVLALLSAALVTCGGTDGASGRLVVFRGIAGNPPRFDLLIVNDDGSDVRPLLGDSVEGNVRPALFARPSWSPDGERIAFDAGFDERGFARDIFVVRADGTGVRRLTSDHASSDPVWSPDGQRILFARSFGRPFPRGSSLWVMAADGSNPRAVTREERGIFDVPGSISPNGTTVAFSRITEPFTSPRSGDVYTIGLDGSNPKRLVRRGADPAYSPDGETIAFVSDRDENGDLCYGDRCFFANELYLMTADGDEQTRLTETNDLNEGAPAWSSDGERISYQRGEAIDNAEGFGVFAVNADGTCSRAVLLDPRLNTWYSAPSWRPDESGPGPIDC